MVSSSLSLRSRQQLPWRSKWLLQPLPRALKESLQLCLQSNGFALIMLWYELAEDPDYDEDGERTATSVLLISGGDTGFNRGQAGTIN